MGGFLTKEQVIVLRQAHKTIRDKRLADRIKAVLSLNSGHEYSQVASILLLDEITLRRYVKRRYQIKYSVIGITKLLHRLGFVYKKPKLVPAKADREAQQQFLDEYFKLKSNLETVPSKNPLQPLLRHLP